MRKYDCKNCIHSKTGGVFSGNKKCEYCTVNSKNINGKPSNYKEKENN